MFITDLPLPFFYQIPLFLALLHCYQKALGSGGSSTEVLNSLPGCQASEIDSGCCGMAGSFGYEKEHYQVSMQMGEDTLFPKVRATAENVKIAAAGTSCRHQIYDGTSREAQHPVSILRSCLK